MAKHLEGYKVLSKSEELEARRFFEKYGNEIPDMEDGDSIGGKKVICGLDEDPSTGRLVIPRGKKSHKLRDVAIQAAGLTDREWDVWRLHCKGNASRLIAEKLRINCSSVTRCLKSINSKIAVARDRLKCAA